MRFAAALCLLAAPVPALAQEDGSGSVVPAAEGERELSTDRPDKTESPYTVPLGRVQVELDFATYSRDRSGDLRTETLAVAPVNLKLGIGRNTDVQVIVEPYRRQTVTDRRLGTRDRSDGFGDVTLRVKRNLWGNDDGRTALAIMPYVTLPTSTGDLGSGKAEFGVIVPLAIELSSRIGVGLMTEIDLVEDDDARGYRASFVNSATVAFTLTERLGMYTELFTERTADWVVTGDIGLTYAASDNTQFDLGANLGISRAADDLAVFAGWSRRF